MCRLADAAADLVVVGGKLQLLCSSKVSCCPHHPAVAGARACGYQRQQLQARQNVRVWIVPAVMLTSAPPTALRRSNRALLGDFDLLVIDEAPWLSFLGGHDGDPEGAATAWLDPRWWEEQETKATAENKHAVLDVLTRLHGIFAGHNLGEIGEEAFHGAGVSADDILRARRILWRWKQDLRPLVRPGATRSSLKRSLAGAAEVNKRVLAIGNVLEKIARRLSGDLAPSGLELIDHPKSGRFLRLRWRKDIHPGWLRAPVLYLDAAGTGGLTLARAWLPRIDLAVEASARAPWMHITQITDSQMGYAKVLPSGSPAKDQTGDHNAEKLARVVAATGREGLVVCPKELRESWEEEQRLSGWSLWNFGSVRGRDEERDVRQLVVISRPLPGPTVVELMAETIFARRVQRLQANQWYGKSKIGRLMSDGTGRLSSAYRHPEPQVEAVRFAICEAELLQAIGRGRGVRRHEHNPLHVLLLTNVPLPLPVTALTTSKDLYDGAGPVEVLASRGVIPLDHQGISTLLPHWFDNPRAVTDWFKYRPDASARFRELRVTAARSGVINLGDYVGIPYKNFLIGNSHLFAAFRYRRAKVGPANLVLVDTKMHCDPRAAVEAVLGPVIMLPSA
jgi:putative DNA primase/helicase